MLSFNDIGTLGKVEKLNCSLHQTFFTIVCKWNPPYVLSGLYITHYRIKDSLEDEVLSLTSSNSTLQYTYDASVAGEHHIVIIPYIDALGGETTNSSVVISAGR